MNYREDTEVGDSSAEEQPLHLGLALERAGIISLIVTYQTDGPRFEHAVREAARLGMTAQIALSIRSDDPRTQSLYDPALNSRWRKRPMTSGEVACYWGHRKAWQMLLADGAPLAIVLEDDFHVRDANLLRSVIDAIPSLPDFDILLFQTHKPRGPVRRWSFGNFCVEDRMLGACGAMGYLISAAGARKLLSRPRVRPVDEDFIAPWEIGLRVLNVHPELVVEIQALPSLLDGQRKARTSDRWGSLRGLILKARWQIWSGFHWLRRRRGTCHYRNSVGSE